MPDTPYSRNDLAFPPDRSPFDAERPEARALPQVADEVKQLREELRLLREAMRKD